ncbi:hypothetical protein I6F07_17320 [Ensifer sp. IC4062]|nr:hypothetical protein [Ensifer sp. IC4062]MCA1441942.1 hypothetical protein [Ensifer sp. IC4062]
MDRYIEAQQKAKRWLLQIDRFEAGGGIKAWLAPEKPEIEFVSAEITGYLVSHLTRSGNLASAAPIVAWLTDVAQDEAGFFRCRTYSRGAGGVFDSRGDIRWVFDTGIILKALLDFDQLSARDELVEPISMAFRALQTTSRGGIYPGWWNVGSADSEVDTSRWSSQPGSFHAKVDRSVVLASKSKGWQVSSLSSRLDFYLSLQRPDGGFISYPSTGGIHSHPHLYSCEGLWALAKLLGRTDLEAAARKGIMWLISAARGGVPPRTVFDNIQNFSQRCDVQAQYLRLLVAFGHHVHAEKAAEALLQLQSPEGCFFFGQYSDGRPCLHPDVWGTAAAVQALEWFTAQDVPDPIKLL